jgi:hypothetical protein
MFLGSAVISENEQLLVLGLSKANVERLEQGQPIRVSRETHGMAVPAGLKIMIFTGETEQSMRDAVASLIGPSTIVDQKSPM